jgi:hypothetical protein
MAKMMNAQKARTPLRNIRITVISVKDKRGSISDTTERISVKMYFVIIQLIF